MVHSCGVAVAELDLGSIASNDLNARHSNVRPNLLALNGAFSGVFVHAASAWALKPKLRVGKRIGFARVPPKLHIGWRRKDLCRFERKSVAFAIHRLDLALSEEQCKELRPDSRFGKRGA